MSLMDMVRGTGRAAEGGKVGDMAAGVAEDRDKAAVGTVGAVGKGILHIPGHNSPFLFPNHFQTQRDLLLPFLHCLLLFPFPCRSISLSVSP